MRKKQKNEILQILDAMQQGVEASKIVSFNNQMNEVCAILTECQDAAISVGEMVEQSEGQGTKAVSLLEAFCELLFEAVNEDNVKKRSRILEQITEKLKQISNCIIDEIPEQKMMVFIPYKASMWDSLESVYFAAKEDKNCIPLVMPIPYFDKNTDGTLGKMHDESEQYPKDIDLISWEKTDLALLHPEVIFFHNPYDETNLVTSVHPLFYSDRLRNATDELVYIPYFICDGNVEEHLCISKGLFRADRIIVQSEEVKDTYVRMWEKTLGKEYGEVARKRIVAIGSPKIDKVLSTRREDEKLPEEWRKLIYRENANGEMVRKKVFLFNTTIQPALNKNEKYLMKLKDVLEIFKNRPEVVLWWRPHPLLFQTLETMRKDLAKEYQEILTAYRKEGWGILDETPELHRAIAQSDAYYGDGGSMLALYRATGKTIMIENINVLYTGDKG